MKMGDLVGIQVFKYKVKAQESLLAYEYIDGLLLTLIEHDGAESFYRDLKRK